MTPDQLGQYRNFLESMGHRVVETSLSLWIDVRPQIYQVAPPFNVDPSQREEVNAVFKATNALACRWFSMDDGTSESSLKRHDVFLYIIKPPYDLALLSQNARSKTRRGLNRVELRRAELNETNSCLAYPVYVDNVKRLRLFKNDEQIRRRWDIWVKAIKNASCAEFWGAWNNGLMVGFSVAVWTPWGTEIVLQRSFQSTRLYPNNALVYHIIRDALERGAPLVSFGLSAYSGKADGLHNFKTSMGFRAVPLNEHIEWHRLLRFLGRRLKPQRIRRAYRLITGEIG